MRNPLTDPLNQILAIVLVTTLLYVILNILRDVVERFFGWFSSRKRDSEFYRRMEELGFRNLNGDPDFWSRVLYRDDRTTLELQLCFDENARSVLGFPVERIHMSIFRHSEKAIELASRAKIAHPKQTHRRNSKVCERHFSRMERLTDCVWSRSSNAKKEEFASFLVCLERHEFDRVTGLSLFERAPFMSPLLKHLLVTLPDEKSHTLY